MVIDTADTSDPIATDKQFTTMPHRGFSCGLGVVVALWLAAVHPATAAEGQLGASILGLKDILTYSTADTLQQQDSESSIWTTPSVPQAVAARREPGESDGPVFLKQPLSYAHRQGQLAIQLPPGARDLSLKLQSHEGFVFGTAFSPETVADEDLDWYLGLTRSRFNGLTPENRFKWPMYEQQPGQYQKAHDTLLKAYIGFAQAANFSLVRGHTLEWGKGRGGFWAHQLECDEYVATLKERVSRDVKLFKGLFNQYDVFNEIIESPGMLEKCDLWNTAFPDAFKWAHEADPDAQLCINELSLIEAHYSPELMRIIKEHVWAHGAPIHCIGIQAHFEHHGVNLTHQLEKLDLLATLGLDLYITEFSLFSSWTGPDGRPYSELDEETQAATTVELFKLWFSHPAVKGIVMWGWWDANIWIRNAGIYKANKQPKAAALAIQDLWSKELSTSLELPQLPNDSRWAEFTGFWGTYEYAYTTAEGQRMMGSVHLGRSAPRQSLVQ